MEGEMFKPDKEWEPKNAISRSPTRQWRAEVPAFWLNEFKSSYQIIYSNKGCFSKPAWFPLSSFPSVILQDSPPMDVMEIPLKAKSLTSHGRAAFTQEEGSQKKWNRIKTPVRAMSTILELVLKRHSNHLGHAPLWCSWFEAQDPVCICTWTCVHI